MEIKLANHQNYTYEQIIAAKDNGGKFIAFQWILPLPLFIPTRRLSKVYFFNKNDSWSKYALKYNTLSRILGWWGMPFGPIYVAKAIRLNNSGGLDVTEDVYLNITKENFANGRIDMIKTATIFMHPSDSELNQLKKVFAKLIENGVLDSYPQIGYCIHTEKDENPYTLIAIKQDLDEELQQKINKAIYKKFYPNYKTKLVQYDSDFVYKNEFLRQALELN